MTLRTRLLLLVIMAMLVPAVLMGLRFVQNRSSEIDAALVKLSATADDISSDLDEKIQGTAQLHYGLARARDLDTRDKAMCSAFLSAVREEYPQFTGILTIDPDGSLFCDSLQTNRSLDLRDREYFKQALIAKGTVTLEPAFGRLTGISVLQIAYPVRSETAELKFVLLASLNLQKFAEYHYKRLMNERARRDPARRQERYGPRCPRGKDRTEHAGASIANSELFRFATDLAASAFARRPIRTAAAMSGPSPARPRSGTPDFMSWSDCPRTVWWRPPIVDFTRIWRFSRWPRCCCSPAYGYWRSGHRTPGQTRRRDGDEARTWRSRRAHCPAPSARRTRAG